MIKLKTRVWSGLSSARPPFVVSAEEVALRARSLRLLALCGASATVRRCAMWAMVRLMKRVAGFLPLECSNNS
jgi:hypothetical protein